MINVTGYRSNSFDMFYLLLFIITKIFRPNLESRDSFNSIKFDSSELRVLNIIIIMTKKSQVR